MDSLSNIAMETNKYQQYLAIKKDFDILSMALMNCNNDASNDINVFKQKIINVFPNNEIEIKLIISKCFIIMDSVLTKKQLM
jgi:hypothetical protein